MNGNCSHQFRYDTLREPAPNGREWVTGRCTKCGEEINFSKEINQKLAKSQSHPMKPY